MLESVNAGFGGVFPGKMIGFPRVVAVVGVHVPVLGSASQSGSAVQESPRLHTPSSEPNVVSQFASSVQPFPTLPAGAVQNPVLQLPALQASVAK